MVELSPEAFAEKVTNQLVGLRVPRDRDPSFVIRCEYNRRFFYAMSPLGSGAVTVARHHAMRFSSKSMAVGMLDSLRDVDPESGWTLIALWPSHQVGTVREP